MTSTKPIRSMTGFAQVRRDTGAGELSVSLRSVNHRGLDLHFHQAHEFAPFENGMRGLLKEHVSRGHIEIRAGLARENGVRGGLDTAALKQYAEVFRSAAASLGLDDKPNLNVLLALPGVMSSQASEAEELGAEFEGVMLSSLLECVGLFNECRNREGDKLAEDMLNELRDVERATAEIKQQRAVVLPAFQKRLREKLSELLNGSGIADARILEECAVLADRSDIQEEVIRLAVHAGELQRILSGGGAIGKQIDFLLQEMNRETNTILAKSSNAGDPGLKITALALAVKANIERIREQALNLE
jgi:uncharacterized protein (TIGR00255 family)